ncbi:MAG: arginyltransferase [Burkholderiales bacterium]
MTMLNDFPLHQLQFYLTAPYPCSYLPEKMARSQVATPNYLIDTSVYNELIQIGFRRSGVYTYRPQCDFCHACVPVRLKTAEFSRDRAQRRAWRRHHGMQTVLRNLSFDPEHYALYRRYQLARHPGGGMDRDNQAQYRQFLLESSVATHLVEFREDDKLRMVSIVDRVYDGLSSVYTFFEPEVRAASLGTYSILWQAEWCQQRGLSHVYLGYWIAQSKKMAYKTKFRPLQGLIRGQWQDLSPSATESGSE